MKERKSAISIGRWIQAAAFLLATSDATAGPNDGKPAPVNAYAGMQEREEVFEFTQKPAVAKQGDAWMITFASKGNCDATVTILDKDGRVVRHLASGVLGKNAPWPFQQNSLKQTIEWDGLTDDFKKADPAGCRVRVSLGLQPKFERNIFWDPYEIPDNIEGRCKRQKTFFVGQRSDGGRVIGGLGAGSGAVRVFDKDWKYVKTVYPPSAEVMEDYCRRCEIPVATTKWGDKVPVIQTAWWGGYYRKGLWGLKEAAKADILDYSPDIVEAIKSLGGAAEYKIVPRAEVGMPKHALPVDPRSLYPNEGREIPLFDTKSVRITVDPGRDLVYVDSCSNFGVVRIDGRTGKMDQTWFPQGDNVHPREMDVGFDGLLYARWAYSKIGCGALLSRFEVDGKKPVDFRHNLVSAKDILAKAKSDNRVPSWAPDITAIYTGVGPHSNTHEKGFDVSPNGNIVTVVEPNAGVEWSAAWLKANGVTKPANGYATQGGRLLYVVVWDRDGNLLTADAVVNNLGGHGVRMDRDGNIYRMQGGLAPVGQTQRFEGIADYQRSGKQSWIGATSLLKFRGLGGKYPVGTICRGKGDVPPDALKVSGASPAVAGALWIYGMVSTDGPDSLSSCTCWNQRFDLDGWARSWMPNIPCYSFMVLDSNGNRILRAGKYGNVDDTEKDVKEGRDGLRFAMPKGVAVSETAAYMFDIGNRRILKAALKYATEEEVPLP